ncbi:MAG: hypothetical protein PHW73_12655 [Atribacterota bacterium]|nr:hypothetical protein [Atribacterota bacterium]
MENELIMRQTEKGDTPSPLKTEEELEIEEAFETQVSGLLSKFGLASEAKTEIDYKSLKKWAISRLVASIALSDYKVLKYCRPKSDKIQWARLTGYHLQILGSFLKEQEIEELKKKMELLENEFIKNRK